MTMNLELLTAKEQGFYIPAVCRVCGCTDDDCARCIVRTGAPCWWVEADLCSACADADPEPVGVVAE